MKNMAAVVGIIALVATAQWWIPAVITILMALALLVWAIILLIWISLFG